MTYPTIWKIKKYRTTLSLKALIRLWSKIFRFLLYPALKLMLTMKKYPIVANSYLEKVIDSVELIVSTKKQRRRFPFCVYTKPITFKNWSIRGKFEKFSFYQFSSVSTWKVLIMPTPSRKFGLVTRWKLEITKFDASNREQYKFLVEPTFIIWQIPDWIKSGSIGHIQK